MSEGLKALGRCAVGAAAGAYFGPAGAAAGCVIGVMAVQCGDERKLPPLRAVDDTDVGRPDGGDGGIRLNGGTDGGQDPDASTPVSDAGPGLDGSVPASDGGSEDAGRDAGSDGGPPVGNDAGSPVEDAGTDAGPDAGPDAGVPVEQAWNTSCHIIGEDDVGMRYVMLVQGSANRSDANNYSVSLDFSAAPGTDANLTTRRQTQSAATWPQDGQRIPDFAQNLTARYFAEIGYSGNNAQLTLRGRDGSDNVQPAVIFPMTFESETDTGEPESIEPGTANEIYPAFSDPLQIAVSCIDAGCKTFSGSVSVTTDTIQSIEIQCEGGN